MDLEVEQVLIALNVNYLVSELFLTIVVGIALA